jgi:hypothetical protein
VSPDKTSEMIARLSTMEQLLLRILATLDGSTVSAGLLKEDFDGQKSRSWPAQPTGQKQPPDPDWIAVLHRLKSPVPHPADDSPIPTEQAGCGQVALYLTRPFSTRERADITAMRVCFPNETDWRQPKPGDISLCSTCGMPINPWSDRDLDYASVLVEVPEVHRVRRRRDRSLASIGPLPMLTPESNAEVRTQLSDLLAASDELLSERDESGA